MRLEITARGMLSELERRWRRWPPLLASEARRYLTSGRSDRGAARLSAPLPYTWLRLPSWLLAKFRKRPAREDLRFLVDVLFAQYALFLYIRIHDDLLDRHVESPWLVYVADRYLVESETAFARHLGDRRFWTLFRACVAETLDGIAETHALQRRRRPDVTAMLESYARVAAIFKLGAAAVLIRHRRISLYPRVAAFKDELAIASQVIDDLDDVDEDLADGRRNSVAAMLDRSRSGGVVTAVDELERRLRSAALAIQPLRLREADRYVARQLEGIARVRRAAHLDQVRRVFGRL